MIVIAYLRISKEEKGGTKYSLERQADEVRAFCRAHKLPEPIILSDDGYSGRNENRPSWRVVVELVISGDVNILLVPDISRMHRSSKNSHNTLALLNQHGVKLVSVRDNVDTGTASGKLLFGVISDLNEHYINSRSESVTRGLARVRALGRKTGGRHTPYGYDLVPDLERKIGGVLVPNVAEQAAICYMLELSDQGYSGDAIARALEAAGIKTKSGLAHWRPNRVRAILASAEMRSMEQTDEDN